MKSYTACCITGDNLKNFRSRDAIVQILRLFRMKVLLSLRFFLGGRISLSQFL
jgi:hypothetical protein